jgi:5-oxoprolinase (ATP-hydrolysing) subunit A
MLLTVDGGELSEEPDALFEAADVVHIACGGHAGDDASMDRAVRACSRFGTRVGAHPSYVDREGFGRRPRDVPPDELAAAIETQCRALAAIAQSRGAPVTSAKPHGALYHAAHARAEVARAFVRGITRALGPVPIVGLAGGELERAAREGGHPYLREAFADRAVRPDGTLVPRGEPGAVIDDPVAAAATARRLRASGTADVLCVHADTPSAVAIVRAVRAALDAT